MLESNNNNKELIMIKKDIDKQSSIGVWTYIWVAIRSYFLQNSFNYANYQGTGYSNVIYPGLVKIYGKKSKKLKEALLANIEFFNSNPQTLPLITSIHLKMLEAGESFEDVRSVKLALMGPLSGIGDSLSQYAWYPLFATIACGMAQNGDITGPILFLISINAANLTTKILTGYFGYKLGQEFIADFSSKMQIIVHVATMVGIMIICALAVKFTHFSFGIHWQSTIESFDKKTGKIIHITKKGSIQQILDNILPFMMPAIWVSTIFLCIKKYKWSVYRVILFTLVFGMVCGVYRILV